MRVPKNVLGGSLVLCCAEPLTGFYRSGLCAASEEDLGRHLVCAVMTREFLEYARARGNDLMTPSPENYFPGLKPGDRWCLCVGRWQEALHAGVAPPVFLSGTHEAALEIVSLEELGRHAVDCQ